MPRKQPTDAQRRAAQEKRDRFRELNRKLAAMPEDERRALVADRGIRTCENHELSFKNQCLVVAQNPKATIVGGFRQWISQKRVVRRGEHGVVIWVPGATAKDDLEDSQVRFLTTTVFDIEQTDELTPEAA